MKKIPELRIFQFFWHQTWNTYIMYVAFLVVSVLLACIRCAPGKVEDNLDAVQWNASSKQAIIRPPVSSRYHVVCYKPYNGRSF